MNSSTKIVELIELGTAIWLVRWGLKSQHRLDGAAQKLRWVCILGSAAVASVLAFTKGLNSRFGLWLSIASIACFVLSLMLPDIFYYLVRAFSDTDANSTSDGDPTLPQ